MEGAVPEGEKDRARKMCRDRLRFLRQHNPRIRIYPRPNGLASTFHKDVEGVLNGETVPLISGFSVPKISTPEEMGEVDRFLTEKEKQLRVVPNSLKVIPWFETPRSIVNAVAILGKYRHRIDVAAFGGMLRETIK